MESRQPPRLNRGMQNRLALLLVVVLDLFATLLVSAQSVSAQSLPQTAPPADSTTAFVRGVVSNSDSGQPILGAHVTLKYKGKVFARTSTNSKGEFRFKVRSAQYEIIFKRGGSSLVRIFKTRPGKVAVVNGRLKEVDGEVIVIRERRRARKAHATNFNRRKTLPYSKAAIKSNHWARTWMVLEVDTEGVVKRLKFMHRPGYGLDEIAIAQAFKLDFEPSLNEEGQPIKTLVLWSYEWPSYWWLIDHYGVASGMPRRNTPLFDTAGFPPSPTSPAPLRGPTKELQGGSGGGGVGRSRFGTGYRIMSSNIPMNTSPGTLADTVPCRGAAGENSGSISSVLRDCTLPDFDLIWDHVPWIYPPHRSK